MYVICFRNFYESPWTEYDEFEWEVGTTSTSTHSSSDIDMWSADEGTWVDSDGTEFERGDTMFENWFLIGVESVHQNSNEDRIFKLHYATSTQYILENCVEAPQSTYHEELKVPSSGESLNWGKNR